MNGEKALELILILSNIARSQKNAASTRLTGNIINNGKGWA
jgi:hypothetical protein